jgi:hypothetical protein
MKLQRAGLIAVTCMLAAAAAHATNAPVARRDLPAASRVQPAPAAQGLVSHCTSPDVIARHECIYAALASSRAIEPKPVN